MTEFLDRVACRLTLSVGGAPIAIEPRQIERFRVALRPWGYQAEIAFRVECRSSPDEDTVLTPFLLPVINTVEASLARAFEEVGETTVPLVLRGVVVDKEVSETSADDVAGAPVLTRHYLVRFTDRAQAFWPHHRPTALLVDKTYADLLAAHLPDGLTLTHDWTASSVQRPVLALALGVDAGAAHFLDFVTWLAHREGVGLFSDPATDTLKIAATKPTASPAAVTLEPDEVARVEITLPAVRRTRVSVLNSYSEGPATKVVANAQAVEGLRSVYLLRSALAAELDRRTTLEKTRAALPLPGARLELARLPAVMPTINRGLALGAEFSAQLFTHGKTYRTIAVDLAGQAAGDEGGVDAETGRRFSLTLTAEVEQASDPVMRLPAFVPPTWPLQLEGKVVSEVGAKTEETYQIYQDARTSQDLYKVEVPLFANQKVIVRFEPVMLSGQFYFPAYKGERVLLSLDFERADFESYLDWRPGGRLPLEGQGNHLLMGKKASSETSVSHVYTDAKPVLTIQRTQDKDQQTIVIKDGTLFMTTLENE